jgi:cytochrome c6
MKIVSLHFSPALVVALLFPVLTTVASATEPSDEKLDLGKQIFLETAQPACSVCHVLAHAGSEGEIGPVLDTIPLSVERVSRAVTNGIGIMPAFDDSLSPEEIEAVSVYVAAVAGKAK